MAVPLKLANDMPAEQLAGKIVLDTNNMPWRDSRFAIIESGEKTVHELRQGHRFVAAIGEGLAVHAAAGTSHQDLHASVDIVLRAVAASSTSGDRAADQGPGPRLKRQLALLYRQLST